MAASGIECSACGKALSEGVLIGGPQARQSYWKCSRCSLVDRTLAARSLRVAGLVGTVLVALNQGDQLLMGTFPFATSWWKIPLTYLVPFCVATYGAISNGYQPVAGSPSEATAPADPTRSDPPPRASA